MKKKGSAIQKVADKTVTKGKEEPGGEAVAFAAVSSGAGSFAKGAGTVMVTVAGAGAGAGVMGAVLY